MDMLAELAKAGAVYDGHHFVYKKGGHGAAYINIDVIYPDVRRMLNIAAGLTRGIEHDFDVVVGPAVGGVALSVYVGCYLMRHSRDIEAIWADKDGGDFVFERAAYAARVKGRRVLVVEDLLTTGSSVRSVCDLTRGAGGEVIGVRAICNRGGVTADDLGAPLVSIADVDFQNYPAEACPLCAANVPIVIDVGHGRQYQEAHPGYAGGWKELLAA